MLDAMIKMRKDQRGFTLIELIMVIVILAILLALALPAYLGTRRRAYLAEANQHLQEMRTHAWLRYVETGSFDGVGNPAPATTYWSFAWGACAGAEQCEMTATGTADPVTGAVVTLVLYNEGNAHVSSTGF